MDTFAYWSQFVTIPQNREHALQPFLLTALEAKSGLGASAALVSSVASFFSSKLQFLLVSGDGLLIKGD